MRFINKMGVFSSINEIDDKIISIVKGIIIGVCLWLLLSMFFPSVCGIETFALEKKGCNCDGFCNCINCI